MTRGNMWSWKKEKIADIHCWEWCSHDIPVIFLWSFLLRFNQKWKSVIWEWIQYSPDCKCRPCKSTTTNNSIVCDFMKHLALEFSLGIELYSKKPLSICLFIHISWEPFMCSNWHFCRCVAQDQRKCSVKVLQFGHVTHSILIHLNTGLQCSVFIALQPEAGLTREVTWSHGEADINKRKISVVQLAVVIHWNEMRKKRKRLNKSVECLSVRRHS